ncbi:MAG TPA: beta-ketoacyl-[acyl-carrier-protein] synthase family protein, partial [Spirochaetota bacterium]
EVLSSLAGRKSGIGPINYLPTTLSGRFPAGEVKLSNEELIGRLGLDAGKYSRTFLLGLLAAREALGDNSIVGGKARRMGLVSATTVGGMDLTEEYFSGIHDGRGGDIRVLFSHDCGSSTEKIAASLRIRGMISTVSTACSSSANAIQYASMLIRNGYADRMLAGGADSLTRFTLNGFSTLKILDENPCNPFDENRNGLNLGEGAAYLLLESEESAGTHPDRILCEIGGCGNACDAFHQTAMSDNGEGPFLSMQKALAESGLTMKDIDYINLHGTGTQNNDLSEGRAIERLCEGTVPAYSTTKSYTGHTLGAAGAIEAVISVLSIQSGMIFPNLNFKTRMKELARDPVSDLVKDVSFNHVMSNSFGFGGNNSSVIFSKVR